MSFKYTLNEVHSWSSILFEEIEFTLLSVVTTKLRAMTIFILLKTEKKNEMIFSYILKNFIFSNIKFSFKTLYL